MSEIEKDAINSISEHTLAATNAGVPERRETEYTRRMKEGFSFFGPATLAYAAFYAFCMFHNGSGITFPFFVAASLWFMRYCLSKLGITLRKGSGFYKVTLLLLGISTFCTDDWHIIVFNKTGIFLLTMCMLLHQFYDTKEWQLGKYFSSILRLVFGSIGELGRPFSDCAAYFHKGREKKSSKVWYVVLGAVIAIPLLWLVITLLASADIVFRSVTETLLSYIRLDNFFQISVMIVWMFLAVYLVLSYLCKGAIKEAVADRRKGEPLLAITIASSLTIVYLIFSGIQFAYLLLGRMQLPDGYTYAEYARSGFFQLLFVSILNLALVLAMRAYFRENKALNIILTVMSLCTFVMIASSALRMFLYIRTYYLTFLRIAVLWGLLVIALLFAGVIFHIYKQDFPLFRYGMMVVTVCYLALSFAHPDYWIARYNIAHAYNDVTPASQSPAREDIAHYRDYYFLSELSADAAPVLIPYLEQLEYDLETFYEGSTLEYWNEVVNEKNIQDLSYYAHSLFGYSYLENLQESTEGLSLRTYNLSRHMALLILQNQINS